VLTEASAVLLDIDAVSALRSAALRAAVLLSADSLGAASRLREMSVEYTGQRSQFGRPIASFQAVKHAVAQMLVDEEAARSIVYYSAATLEDAFPDAHMHAAAAKAQIGPSAIRIAESALTVHGAIGYTWEHDLHLLYKRVHLNAVLFGDARIWNERIAEALELI
jgi:alkylation response protein AidB-like acyl-CoA dehydrogenase